MSNFLFFIGCDVSKAVIDVSFHKDGKPHYLGQFLNNDKGFKSVLKQLLLVTSTPIDQWFFCFENTGIYSKPLLRWCMDNNIPCREENALKISRSLGLRRGKDDKVDSIDICQYAFEKRDSIIVSSVPKPLIIKLKKLLSRRDFLVRQRQSLKVSLKEQKGFIADEIYESLNTGNKVIIDAYNNEIGSLESTIQELMHIPVKLTPAIRLIDPLVIILFDDKVKRLFLFFSEDFFLSILYDVL